MQEKQELTTRSHGWFAVASHQREHTCQACQKLKRHASWSTTGQNRTIGRSVTSRLELATQSSREPALFWKTWLFTFHSHPNINTPFTHERKRASRENFERETLEKKKDWLIHNLYLRDSSNSSTLFLSIVKSLRGLLPKLYLTISISMREPFGVWEAVRKGSIHIGWCYGEVTESSKLDRKSVV